MTRHPIFLSSLFALLATCLSACSVWQSEPLSPDAKITVLRLSQNYLATIILGNETKLSDYIAWSDYVAATGPANSKFSHQQFSEQLAWFTKAYKAQDPRNPLLQLKVKDISGSNDVAKITLVKADGSSSEEIWIKFVWTGAGWLVMEDSLFGKEKLFDRLAKDSLRR